MSAARTSSLGVAADHGGYQLKEALLRRLSALDSVTTSDFGARVEEPDDDYPDFVVPLSQAISRGELSRGLAICGSGVGASIAANRARGVRAAVIHDAFSAHQGVEHDDVNVLCLGAKVVELKSRGKSSRRSRALDSRMDRDIIVASKRLLFSSDLEALPDRVDLVASGEFF